MTKIPVNYKASATAPEDDEIEVQEVEGPVEESDEDEEESAIRSNIDLWMTLGIVLFGLVVLTIIWVAT